ncbi:hypothetical protein K3495_g6728 [Podosphaera aphanis]|nr:hypothetical protein K3495_g6728 [Podosphaera aphanis]
MENMLEGEMIYFARKISHFSQELCDGVVQVEKATKKPKTKKKGKKKVKNTSEEVEDTKKVQEGEDEFESEIEEYIRVDVD